MNVLVIGSGGREHALVSKLAQSRQHPRLFALPGSAAIGRVAECLAGVDPLNSTAVVELCKEHAIDLVVIGPEAPLAAGLADRLEASGIAAFGPGHAAARLESSKAFAKQFLRRHGIATADFEIYDDPARASDAAMELPLPLVVKADGLAAGKGVRIGRTRQEALEAVQDFMIRDAVGEAGRRVVLERCLDGPEASVLVFCDGESWKLLPVARDHKRLEDGDAGPNTGGMGAYAPAPDVDGATTSRIEREILTPVMAGLKAERLKYRGVLYCGLMLTAQGPQVLEFNARFGDPETQAILPLLESDLLDLLDACARGRLDPVALKCQAGASVCVVLVSEGYPERPITGRRIHGIEAAEMEPDVLVFHAGTRRSAEGWMTAAGRVLNVVATAPDVARARARAYAAAARIHFDGMRYRKDIALPGSLAPPRGASSGGPIS